MSSLLPSSSPQNLRIKRPTPTTISFTVSTAPPAETLTARASLYLSYFIRLLLILSVIILFYTKWQLLSAEPNNFIVDLCSQSSLGQTAVSIIKDLDWRYMLPVGLLVLWLSVRRGYTEESLLVLRGLGVQTSSSSPTYLTTASTKFIPTTMIQDIFIHEAFKGFEVRFYLAIVVEGEEDVVVVFPTLLPRRAIVEDVWRGAKSCLYEPKS